MYAAAADSMLFFFFDLKAIEDYIYSRDMGADFFRGLLFRTALMDSGEEGYIWTFLCSTCAGFGDDVYRGVCAG